MEVEFLKMDDERVEMMRISVTLDIIGQVVGALGSIPDEELDRAINRAEQVKADWPTEHPVEYAKIEKSLACQLRTLGIAREFKAALKASALLCECDTEEDEDDEVGVTESGVEYRVVSVA